MMIISGFQSMRLFLILLSSRSVIVPMCAMRRAAATICFYRSFKSSSVTLETPLKAFGLFDWANTATLTAPDEDKLGAIGAAAMTNMMANQESLRGQLVSQRAGGRKHGVEKYGSASPSAVK